MGQELGQGFAVAGWFGGEGAPIHAHASETRNLGQANTLGEPTAPPQCSLDPYLGLRRHSCGL
jgi:hypothetical protein